jgi:hypothetical protein
MTRTVNRIARVIAQGFACAAQAVAFREGMHWDPAAAIRPQQNPLRKS